MGYESGAYCVTEVTYLVVYVCTWSGFPLTDETPSTEEHHEASAEQVIEYARSVDLSHQTNAVDRWDVLHHNV